MLREPVGVRMTAALLQGVSLNSSQISASIAIETAIDTRQSLVHAHFPMFNGLNADGTWKGVPMWHPTQPQTPYFPLALANDLWNRGQLLLMSWGAQNLQGHIGMKAEDAVAGKYDTYLHAQAKAMAAWKHPLIVALNPEFNGTWSSWYLPPADFVTLWRYIVDLFRKDGATNVGWCWTSNQLSQKKSGLTTAEDELPKYWPGADWVDFTGLDTYNGAGSRGNPWLTFDQIMTGQGLTWLGNTYGALQQLGPNTPMIIGEFGCHTTGGDKAGWIRDAVTGVPSRYPQVMAISYYDIDDGPSLWSLRQNDGTARAWEDSIEEGPYVQGGQFTMPPDLQVLKPFTRTIMVGDPIQTIAGLQGQITASSATVADLQGHLTSTLLTLNQETDLANTLQSSLASMTADRDGLRVSLDLVMNDRDAARQDAAQAKSDLAAARADLGAARGLLSDLWNAKHRLTSFFETPLT
jgi:hypothetical protein